MLRYVGNDAVTNKLSVVRSCLQMPCYYVALSEMEVLEILQLGVPPRQDLLFSSTCSLKILFFFSHACFHDAGFTHILSFAHGALSTHNDPVTATALIAPFQTSFSPKSILWRLHR